MRTRVARGRAELQQLLRRIRTGDQSALDSLVRLALALDALSVEGRAARRAAARVCVREARRLAARALGETPDAARASRAEANRYFALAVVVRSDQPRATPRRTAEPVLLDPVPDPPQSVFAGAATANSILINWSPPSSTKPITGYFVTRYTYAPGLPVSIQTLAPLGVVTQSIDAGLVAANTYAYTVSAQNADGRGGESLQTPQVSLLTIAPAAPAAPQLVQNAMNVKATVPGPVVAGALAYAFILYRETTPGSGTYAFYQLALSNVPPIQPNATFLALSPASYKVGARVQNAGGFGQEALSAPLNLAPVNLTGFTPPNLPALSSGDVLPFDNAFTHVAEVRKLMSEAVATGNKWRYDHLKAQAVKAAGDTMQYESYVAQLMSMMMTKASTAELLLAPALKDVYQQIKDDSQNLSNLASGPDVAAVVQSIGDAASRALVLEALLAWFIEYDPVDFWVGLFNKLIDDVAAFDGGLSRTTAYLDAQFGNPAVGVGQAAANIASALHQRLATDVERMAAPLRAAVDKIIGDTSAAMRSVYESYDGTLTMVPSGVAGQADVPNVNPLAGVLGQLSQAVENLVNQIKALIDAVLTTPNQLASLCRFLMIAYVVTPLLAFLVITIAGGPFAAAALAGIVLVAAQELVHLLARWLVGPLRDQVGHVKEKLEDQVKVLQDILNREAQSLANPAWELELLAGELLELKNLLPEAFLDDAAALLDQARRVVIQNALQLALGAQHALGLENATAFDVMDTRYESFLHPAPQLPDGAHPGRLAGAALLRDLDVLERRRTGMRDGKEMEVTLRLSLYRLLGGVGDPAAPVGGAAGLLGTMLANGQGIVHLSEEVLADRMFPGLYRALIKDVRVRGIFNTAFTTSTWAIGVPLTLTHQGVSRTRVKRSANPAAPPLTPPDCLPSTFMNDVFGPAALSALVDDTITFALAHLQYPQVTPWPPFFPSYHPLLKEQLPVLFMQFLPDELVRRSNMGSCGLIDTSAIRAVAQSIVAQINWGGISECQPHFVFWPWPPHWQWTCPPQPQTRNEIQAINIPGMLAALQGPAQQAFDAAIALFEERVGRWGEVYLIEDRDPYIRSLGFATLERRSPRESATFNLLPDTPLAATTAVVGVTGVTDLPPTTPNSTLQYRPFENRGLEGDILISFGTSANLATLVDVFLDITVRACFDESLAASVKASQSQAGALGKLANAWAAASGQNVNITSATLTPMVQNKGTDLRTIHYSFRAHRDRMLLSLLGAAEAVTGVASPAALPNPTTVDGVTFVPTTQPLALTDPFTPLSQTQTVTLQFQPSRSTTFANLVSTIAVTPDDLGYGGPLLSDPNATVESIGIAIIPMNAALVLANVSVDATLQPLLPTFGSATFLPGTRLVITPLGRNPVKLTDVWAAGTPKMTLDLGQGITNNLVYDVVFSLSVRVPALSSVTSLSALTGVTL
jgi:fibronectin type III domain protein